MAPHEKVQNGGDLKIKRITKLKLPTEKEFFYLLTSSILKLHKISFIEARLPKNSELY